ncbi:hypothetical protein A6A08_06925 [Nocardiopsis sp. TSRI0078]|uniref:hypothetical protein n=1 Tax=unclassified Nocardiopsis TaxID=2649073 RepID=UPI00093E168F|nr:hypothetical protein [Nocardiopsis sp. TSRI0078]OKI16994.1 hypothetical protein A6A08_06925 [Nocardiopsis sp. TSRI0078]
MSASPRPPVPPRPVTGVFVQQVLQTACPWYFALVWADFEPLPDDGAGAAFAFTDDLPATCDYPGEPLPEEFVRAFAQDARESWEDSGGGHPLYAARVVLRDAIRHDDAPSPQGFTMAGRLAVREALDCVTEDREPRRVGRKARPDHPVPPMPRTLRPSGGSPPT